ncbi:ergothioneine biosynthesis protein EgtC [Rhodococcoides corynebacterioides]|uniref:ergothioneine biosynthesis protein EgtC n=1 Tax=Rhodococcoides corynebacterioides TaxID=53972 RepID=UPI001C9B6305|nr:ergothioneine biosynthesis protein EgtC [Rhodococcus corynebacterioides]MBY6351339.1 ergothioneine biosynthesis protein EgtC [Rhodococcus corynebacterioides]
MCRHLGYLGPARSVGDVLTAGTSSLMQQSWAPRDMRGGGTVNADGFGAAWWTDDGVGHYRNPMPIWTDPAVTDTLTSVRSTAVVAAIRSATVGMPVDRSACAPFVAGRFAFSHNGVVGGWPHSVAGLAADVPAADLLRLTAPTDAAALWVLLQHRLDEQEPGEALAGLVRDVDAAAPGSRLNLLLSDGRTLWATAVHHALSVRVDGASAVVASEPTDDDADWRPVPDRSIVTAAAGSLDITPLDR